MPIILVLSMGSTADAIETDEQSGNATAAANAATDNQRVDSRRNVTTIPTKVSRYSRRLLKKYDLDKSRKLEEQEWQALGAKTAEADANQDKVVTEQELAQYIADYGRRRQIRLISPPPEEPESPQPVDKADPASLPSDKKESLKPSAEEASEETDASPKGPRRDLKYFVPASRLPKGLPQWFFDRDANGDGQLTLREFAPKSSKSQRDNFSKLDLNRDGLVTSAEYARASRSTKPKKAEATTDKAKP